MNSRKKFERREIAMPQNVAERYKGYCEATKQKITEPMQALIIECIPHLHNTEKLDRIILKTKNWNTSSGSFQKFHVQIPDEAAKEIYTYCNFFKLNHLKSHFVYYLIEEKLLQDLERILKNE